MDSPHRNLDRLLPRHQVQPSRVELEWDLRPPRRLLRQPERYELATVVDLSLDGALVETDLDIRHDVDDVVVLRLGGATGRAIVRHKRLDDDGTSWLYGVRWLLSPELKAAVERAVEQLRERSTDVKRSWEQHRR
ncbi:MAG: hypothetical protein AAF081_17260 [Actinomycetota bacterium]